MRQYETADALRARRETHERYSERPDDLEGVSASVLALRGDESVLDVGCGYGLLLKHLRAAGHRGRLVGLDRSPGMVAAAGGGIVGDAEALPFGDRAFDVVAARHMLYHVPDIPAAVRELRRVAGVALVVTNADDPTPHLRSLIHDAAPWYQSDGPRFHGGNARAYLEASFGHVELTAVDSALLFSDVEPIVRYVQSALFDKLDWPAVEPSVRAEAQRRLDAMGGLWRDPKGVRFFRCF